MFDFLIWSKIVRDSSLSNWPFFTRIYKAQRRVWASHVRLVPSSGLYRKSDTRMGDVYVVFKNCIIRIIIAISNGWNATQSFLQSQMYWNVSHVTVPKGQIIPFSNGTRPKKASSVRGLLQFRRHATVRCWILYKAKKKKAVFKVTWPKKIG